MKTELTPQRAAQRSHQHYTEWFRGNGSQTEFLLQHAITSFDDIDVFLNGFLYKPATAGVNEDYQVRGLTPGYTGEKNAIRFTIAPPANWDVCVKLVAT